MKALNLRKRQELAAEQRKSLGEFLSIEYKRVGDDIRSMESYNDRVLAVGVTISIGACAAIWSSKAFALFFAVPFLVLGVLGYGLMLSTWVSMFGAYKRHIELNINKFLGSNILLWERVSYEFSKRLIVYKYMTGMYLFCATVVISVSVLQVRHVYGVHAFWCEVIGIVIVSAFLCAAIRQFYNIRRSFILRLLEEEGVGANG